MISFEPTEDQKMMVESARQFAKSALRPKIRETEKHRELPAETRKAAFELGLGLVALPESVGGAGLGYLTAVLLEEEVAWGDAAAAFALGGPGAFGIAVTELGTPEQAKEALAPFAEGVHFGAVAWGEKKANRERPGLSTIAKDGVLNGEKAFVVNAELASSFVVFAQVDPAAGWNGLGAFLVDRNTPGLTVLPRETTLGLDAVSFGGIALKDVKAKARLEPKDFNAALVRFFARHALIVAARGVGLSRAAFEETLSYVDNRKAFGKPIGHFQAVAFNVADRAMDVDAARGLVWRAAAAWDAFDRGEAKEHPAILATAQAAAFTHEAAMRCGDDGVQLHGGAGFMRDYPVEKFMRDAKQLGLCGLTAEHADQLAGAVALRAPLDPGLVLPTAETQNAFV